MPVPSQQTQHASIATKRRHAKWLVLILLLATLLGLFGLSRVFAEYTKEHQLSRALATTESESPKSSNRYQANSNKDKNSDKDNNNDKGADKDAGDIHNYSAKIASIPTSPAQSNHNEAIALNSVVIDKVFVKKSTRRMQLLSQGKVIRSYHIALGDNPKGHKTTQGDERTPEGIYTLDYKNENSIAYRSIHINYPNKADIAQAKARGVDPGGAIMIHGQVNGYERFTEFNQQRNWTDGCIAVTNDEMDEIMDAVRVGTPIEIEW